MDHKPTPAPPNERREHLWAVLGALTLRRRHSEPDAPPQGAQKTSAEHEEGAQGWKSPLKQTGVHPLDVAFDLLSSLTIHLKTTDTDLLLEAVRAERLKVKVEQHQQALLTLLNNPSRQQNRSATLQGRDLLAEVQANAVSDEELEALLPWPARGP